MLFVAPGLVLNREGLITQRSLVQIQSPQPRVFGEAGAELILLNPVFDEAEQMERLVAEAMPQLS